MTNSRKTVQGPDAPVQYGSKTIAAGDTRPDPAASLWAVLPSAEQLKQIVAEPAKDRDASLDLPRSLLNPLASLPRPLSLDEVKEGLRATGAQRRPKA